MPDSSDAEYTAYVHGRIPALRRVAYLLSGDEHEADDLVQETVTKLYARWPRMAGVDNLDGYVHTMLVRTFLDATDGLRRFAWYRYRVATNRYEPLPEPAGMPARVAANGWVAGVAAGVTVFSSAGVLSLPKYRTDHDYTVASYSENGLVVGGTSATADLVNRALMWRCR